MISSQETPLFIQPEIKSCSQVYDTRPCTEAGEFGSYSHAPLL